MSELLHFGEQAYSQYYLYQAIGALRQTLENHIKCKQNQLQTEAPLPITAEDNYIEKPSNLQRLCDTFELDNFERDILLLCAGIELDEGWEELCAIAQEDNTKAYPTFRLAMKIFNDASWKSFTPVSPLRKWDLIEFGISDVLFDTPIKINEQVLHYLMGYSLVDKSLMGIFEPLETDNIPPLVNSHQQLVGEIKAIWQHTLFDLPIIQFIGNTFSCKQTIVRKICAHFGVKLYTLRASKLLLPPSELYQLTKMVQRQMLLNQSVVLLECDINTNDTAQLTNLKCFIESVDCPLIISSYDRLSIDGRTHLIYNVQKPTTNEQRTIWNQLLGEKSSEYQETVYNLVSQFNLTAPQIRAIYAKAVDMEKDEEITAQGEKKKTEITSTSVESSFSEILWNTCRIQARPKLDELAQRINKSASWQDLVLNDKQMRNLQTIAAHIKKRYQVYHEWGFAKKGERGLGVSALFAGTSGTGKTMSAEVLASYLQLDLYRIDLSTVVSKYIGETEKNLRRIFDAAEGGGAILLFDEADALFGKRSDVKDARDRYANMEVSYLLQRIEQYQGLAILTTNLRESIDEAFLRRIRFIVNYSFPDATHREKIWRRIFPKDTPTHELNYRKLGKLNVAGGNIRNIALNAAFIAKNAQEPVMMKHILSAAQDEYTKLERLLTDVEVKGWV